MYVWADVTGFRVHGQVNMYVCMFASTNRSPALWRMFIFAAMVFFISIMSVVILWIPSFCFAMEAVSSKMRWV